MDGAAQSIRTCASKDIGKQGGASARRGLVAVHGQGNYTRVAHIPQRRSAESLTGLSGLGRVPSAYSMNAH